MEFLKAKLGRDPLWKLGIGALVITLVAQWAYTIVTGSSLGTSIHYSTGYRIALAIALVLFVVWCVWALRRLIEAEHGLDKAEADLEKSKAALEEAERKSAEYDGHPLLTLSPADANALQLWLESASGDEIIIAIANDLKKDNGLRFIGDERRSLRLPLTADDTEVYG